MNGNTATHRNSPAVLAIGLVTLASLLGNGLQVHAQAWVDHAAFPGYPRTILLDPLSSSSPPASFVGGSKATLGGVVAVAPDGTSTPASGSGPDTCFAMACDESGVLYAAGDSAPGIWCVHESVDGGTTWSPTPVDAFSLGSQYSSARGIASDRHGNVFVCGGATDAAGYPHWVVRRRDAAGDWLKVQDYSIKRSECYATRLCIVNDALIVVGRSANKWMVQRGRNLGAASINWDPPYTWVSGKNAAAGANAVAADADGAIYVSGVIGSEKFGYGPTAKTCVLQKSVDGGTTWAILATLEAPGGADLIQPCDLALDSSRNVFLVGAAFFSYSPTRNTVVSAWKWLVSQRDATSGIWTFSFPFGVDPSTGSSLARGIATDTAGEVLVVGPVRDAAGDYVGFVQRLQRN